MKQQKSNLFDKLIPILVQTTKTFEEQKIPTTSAFKQYGIQTQLGKKSDEVHRIYKKAVKVTELFFDNIVTFLDPFRNFTSIRNTIGSELKRVATGGSVAKRYQPSLFAQLSKSLLENVNFRLTKTSKQYH